MNKTKKTCFWLSGLLFLLFILFTIAVKTIDVKPVGPEQSSVGFASLNQFIFEHLNTSLVFYNLTTWLGMIAIAVAVGFALLGLLQFIKRKSFKHIDKSILALGAFYILVMVFYVLFEKIIINYRPLLMENKLEASYPSSHTLLVVCIMATAIMQFHERIKSRPLLIVLDTISVLIIALTVIGRLLSGVHWFTDIIGSLLLSASLIVLYYSIIKKLGNQAIE